MTPPKLKTFVDPSNVDLEKRFDAWSADQQELINIIETHLMYSAALQKFVMSVIYHIKEE